MSSGLVGSRLGKYEILAEIGQGGMSVVYRALDTQLNRHVAIKVLHNYMAEQKEARVRFHREAMAVARLRHPNIIEIYDYSGENTERSYIVTELIDGFSLATILGHDPLIPPEAAIIIGRAIADALAHAHEHDVIHRDLKPENILVDKKGALKLTDFGIARILDGQNLTVTGTLLGSPAYMAPEYIDGAPTDARTDIFAFGTMLYQFVTGELPFAAKSPHALLKRILTGQYTPAEQCNPSVHAAIARLIKRALARDPMDRFQTARELLTVIDNIINRIGLNAIQEMQNYLTDISYGQILKSNLVNQYANLGKKELSNGHIGAALEDFDRVLADESNQPEVRRLINRLTRRALAGRILRNAGIVLLGTVIVTLIGSKLLNSQLLQKSTTSGKIANASTQINVVRNVTFLIQGSGDLYIDGFLVKHQATDAISHELLPGKHHARLVNKENDIAIPFSIPLTGAIAPIKINATKTPTNAATDIPSVTNQTITPKIPSTDIEAKNRFASHFAPADSTKNKIIRFRIAGGLWVNVKIDNEREMREQLSPVPIKLAYGEHQLRFSNPCCEPVEIKIKVNDTEPPQLEPINLKPSPARLFIEGAPVGALVEVAGKREGLRLGEPIFIPMTVRGPTELLVVVKKENHTLLQQTIRFEPGREHRLVVNEN
ncbi:MAG: serine/threonine protein kinase [Deltaproteobacteria bacterium]|nr:serine/threonine protein kinase [Deltaproteobacteria bacterium]